MVIVIGILLFAILIAIIVDIYVRDREFRRLKRTFFFKLIDHSPDCDGHVTGKAVLNNDQFLELYFNGYGEKTAVEGYGSPAYFEFYEGSLWIRLAMDINAENVRAFTLEGARESERVEDENPN